MTSSRKKVIDKDAPVQNKTKSVATNADPLAALCALMPSAEQLRLMVAGPAKETRALSSGGILGVPLHDPSALLNPLASLPRPLSLDEVRALLRATDAAYKSPTK